MVEQRKKKYESGEGAQCYTRNTALRELQLPLTDCRKLCILTGIYPRESCGKKYDKKEDSWFKTLYYEKDVQFVLPEPIWKLRELKVYRRKVCMAKSLRQFRTMKYFLHQGSNFSGSHCERKAGYSWRFAIAFHEGEPEKPDINFIWLGWESNLGHPCGGWTCSPLHHSSCRFTGLCIPQSSCQQNRSITVCPTL